MRHWEVPSQRAGTLPLWTGPTHPGPSLHNTRAHALGIYHELRLSLAYVVCLALEPLDQVRYTVQLLPVRRV